MGVKKVVIMFIFRFSCRCIGFGYVFCCLISSFSSLSVRLMMYIIQYSHIEQYRYDSPYTVSHCRVLVVYIYLSSICSAILTFVVE